MPDSRLQDISDQLRQHTPLDATEAAHLAATLHFLETCNSNPLSRDTAEGHMTASCVAIHPNQPWMVILWHKKSFSREDELRRLLYSKENDKILFVSVVVIEPSS